MSNSQYRINTWDWKPGKAEHDIIVAENDTQALYQAKQRANKGELFRYPAADHCFGLSNSSRYIFVGSF